MLATNIIGLPRTGLVDTNVIRTTKTAAESIALDPVLLPFRLADGSFNRDLTMPFTRGAMVNVQVAPVLTANQTSDISGSEYEVDFQEGNFTQVAVKLDYVTSTGWKRTQIQEAVSDINEGEIRGREAGNALVKKMYRTVITRVANDPLIPADQQIGNAAGQINENAIIEMRTKFEAYYGVSRETMVNMIVDPYSYGELTKIDRFTNNDYVGGQGEIIRRGLLSTVHNVRIFSDYNMSLTGGSSQSISGSVGAKGIAFLEDSFVLPIRRLGVMDPTRQYEALIDGIPLLATLDNDITSQPGLVQNNKFDIVWGIKNLPSIREDNSVTGTKVFVMKGSA